VSEITILPAIDLQGGRCVRLRQGRADDATVYSDDPVAMAHHWEDLGAEYLHVVDLDGAFEGRPVHHEVIGQIARSLSIPVQTGGGLRTDRDIALLVEQGVDRVILGTRACAKPETLKELLENYAEKLAVGIDARDGMVQVKGWTETTAVSALSLAGQLDALGLKTIIYTDTSRDGMLEGVNAKAMGAMAEAVSCRVIASGGVSSPADVAALKALDRPNLTAAIVGKALYEETVSFAELQAAGRG
jgi:phosphoribosylformimino-5-aminoimidazole carboxamide ribotide isomerase